ncbi:ATP-binding protein [Roseburia hominis]
MKGSHRIIVESKKVKYDFIIKRNITILTGDSGSGKTVLIDFIREYRRYGADSGVFLSCDCECKTIDNEDWERQIEETSNSIIFIDEGNRFLTSKRFAELALQSDNYFVLATREKLPMLPYSVNEIYGFRQSGKFHEAKKKYNEIYHLYGEISERDRINPQFVITDL